MNSITPFFAGEKTQNTVGEPDFISTRIDAFAQRITRDWSGHHLFLDGARATNHDIVLLSNDYLSIAKHPDVIRAQVDSLQCHGNGMVMSAVFLGGDTPQRAFEAEMAAFMDAPAALLCQSGWAANVGLLQSIARRDVPVYIDLRAHMSLWEGITSAGAVARPFRHNNPEHLEQLLRRHGR